MNQVADNAIVLSRVDYGERDRILTLLTEKHGKISVIAKGVRSQKSRLAAGIELLSISEVSYIDGKNSLKTLTGARLVRHYGSITADMQRMKVAFGALKAIYKLVEEGSGEEYYELVRQLIVSLDDKNYDTRLTEIWFGVKLLHATGVLADIKPAFDQTLGTPLFEFDHSISQFVYKPDGPFMLNDLKLLRLSLSQPKPVKLDKPTGSEDRLALLIALLVKTNLIEL